MKKLLTLFIVMIAATAAYSQPTCPPGQQNQVAKWRFLFRQCFDSSAVFKNIGANKVAFIDQNGVLSTVTFEQIFDSLHVDGVDGSQWAIQVNDSGQFGSSDNFNFNTDLGVFYIYDFNGDTLFSANTQTREIRTFGSFDLPNKADSTVAFLNNNREVTVDSTFLRAWSSASGGVFQAGQRSLGSLWGLDRVGSFADGTISGGGHLALNGANFTSTFNRRNSLGTLTSPTAMTVAGGSGRVLSRDNYFGYQGSGFSLYGRESWFVSRNFSSTEMRTRYVFDKYDSATNGILPAFTVEEDGSMVIYNGNGVSNSTAVITGRRLFVYGSAGAETMYITTTPAAGTTDVILRKNTSTGQVTQMAYEQDVYTPTDSARVNLDALTLNSAMYERRGNLVTVWGTFTTDATASGTSSFFMTVPIPTNLAAPYVSGYGGALINTTPLIDFGTTQKVRVRYVSGATTVQTMSYSFTYRIQ